MIAENKVNIILRVSVLVVVGIPYLKVELKKVVVKLSLVEIHRPILGQGSIYMLNVFALYVMKNLSISMGVLND